MVTIEQLDLIAGKKVDRANAGSVLQALKRFGPIVGLNVPHREVQFLAQLMHESGAFRYDREVWGPTPAQLKYEGRKDLGNTQPGDGKKFAGHTAMQITGRANTKAFRDWCRKLDPTAPDFVALPQLMNTDPWEGLGPIWYWDTRGLNRFADTGDVEMITKRINGGLNGYDDRLRYLVRASLVYLGRDPNDLEGYQKEKGLIPDGILGPKSRAAIHADLLALTPGATESKATSSAPVVEEKPVAVVPKELDKPATETKGFWERIFTLVGLSGIGGASWLGDWKVILALAGAIALVTVIGLIFHAQIIARVKELKEAVNG